MSLILIEGIDRSGKSTLAKLVAIHMSCGVKHCSKPKTNDPFQEYLMMYDETRKYRNLVLDRSHLGEYVYSNLWRGGCRITNHEFRQLDNLASLQSAIVIHAYASVEDIIDRCRKVGEDLLKPDQIEKCLQLFEIAIKNTTLPVYKYDSSKYTPNQFFEQIKPELTRLRELN